MTLSRYLLPDVGGAGPQARISLARDGAGRIDRAQAAGAHPVQAAGAAMRAQLTRVEYMLLALRAVLYAEAAGVELGLVMGLGAEVHGAIGLQRKLIARQHALSAVGLQFGNVKGWL